MKPRSQDDYVKTALRLPPDLHTELKAAADLNQRSLNAEILARLTATPGVTTALLHLSRQQTEMQESVREILERLPVTR